MNQSRSSHRRNLLAATLIASVFAIGSAHADIEIRLTTTQLTECVATLDSQGLRRAGEGASAPFTAKVRSIAGEGCAVGGGSEFGVVVTTPAEGTVGVPFLVTWSASSSAAVCTYGEPTSSSVSGWMPGSVACQGPTCAGTHTRQVTVYAPGTYAFNMTCTNATGFAQATLQVAPASPP